ncbi:Trimethyllysine dioxygenase [Atractiella rhizophila]|nr:Trimethyllysine dioxygenase [Atractiella rhizophila]
MLQHLSRQGRSLLACQHRRFLATAASLPSVHSRGQDVEIKWGDSKAVPFYNLWLRDNCRCSHCYHPVTKQRLVDTFKLSQSIEPTDIAKTADGVTITWNDKESHTTFYPWHFLHKQAFNSSTGNGQSRVEDMDRVLWDATIAEKIPTVDYEEIMHSGDLGEKSVFDWAKKIRLYGFAFIRRVPPNPESTEKLLRRLCFIRETHYGGFWDFTANMEHGDLAYSDVWLNAHTDGTYWTDPPGLQLFHLLSPSNSHEGGHNLLVDGFKCASILRTRQPELYHTLATTPIPTQAKGTAADGKTVDVRPLKRWTAFEHDVDGETLIRVRWNGDDRRTMPLFKEPQEMRKWYEAAMEWEKILRDQKNELWTKMDMGTAIIFDNHRVLHGRSSFTGSRRLCGAYLNHDDFISRLRTLEKKFAPSPTLATQNIKVSRLPGDDIWDD